MLKVPVAHDGYGRGAKRLLRLALMLSLLPALCLTASVFQECGQRERRLARRDVAAIGEALTTYRARTGNWPDEERWVETLVSAGLLEKPPDDPWGHPYRYRLEVADGGTKRFRVISLGPDGEPGTSDDIPRRSWP